MGKEYVASKKSKCHIPFKITISFDAFFGKEVVLSTTNKGDIKLIQECLDKGMGTQVFFPDYETI